MKRMMMAASVMMAAACAFGAENTLTDKEKAEGWRLLWDGATTAGWRTARKNNTAFPEKGWLIQDGELSVIPKGGGGDIITVEKFTDFILKVDYKVTKAANSGIKYFIDPDINGGTSLEYQVLDPQHPDAKLGLPGTRWNASFYDVICAPKGEELMKPLGEWNTAMIVSKGPKVEHWLNGEKVLEFERGSEAFRAAVLKSKFKGTANWGETKTGHILLQDHNDQVWFRNIKIKVLE
ncbi:MAG: DUF1080 domain-containing protein [Kiritimatiellaeota bacterium]|nr:DUF1080 domain-containing protein [Kiritimatiellota bacterium]